MLLHITFADGSNPFFKIGSKAEIAQEIRRWKRQFGVVDQRNKGGGIWLTLISKRSQIDLFEVS